MQSKMQSEIFETARNMTGNELLELGTKLVNDADTQGLTLRLCGGIAVLARCPSIETHPTLQRSYSDLDLVSSAESWSSVPGFLTAQGFAHKSASQTSVVAERAGVTVEVLHPQHYRDRALDLTARVTVTPLTLPLADLLLLKLARADFQIKDLQDCSALLADHRVTDGGDEDEDINRTHIYQTANKEYRLWKTVFDNSVTLEKNFDKYLEPEEAQLAWRRNELLQEVLDGKSHSFGWWAGRLVPH